MIELLPRPLRLLEHYEDGEQARHFRFRLEAPVAADLQAVAGQFFMLVVPGHGEAPFTYVSLPDGNGEFTTLIRRMGNLTQALFALPAGALLGYRGPLGHGWPAGCLQQRLLVVAGGCGLAPLAGVIETAARQNLQALSVVYGARHAAAQVLGRERARWREKLRFIETFDQPAPGQRGGTPLVHLDELFAAGLPDAVLCCGPERLMLASAEACCQRGVPGERIWLSMERRMHCGVGLCGHCYIGASYACTDGPTYRYDHYLSLQRACPSSGRPAQAWHC